MKYSYTILYVPNVQEALDFYIKAFGFEQQMITPEGDYGELKTGDTKLAFINYELANSNLKDGFIPSKKEQKSFGIELAFITENIEADFQKALDAGATLAAPLAQKVWGQKIGYLRDNNGFLIELGSPMEH